MENIIFNASTVRFTDEPHYFYGTTNKRRHAEVDNSIGAHDFEFLYGYSLAMNKPEIIITYQKRKNSEVALIRRP